MNYSQDQKDPKQKLCTNQGQEISQTGNEFGQDYNYPHSQQNPQQQYHYANPPPQQQNNLQLHQAYVYVVPENVDAINPELFHQGQKKYFTKSVVTLWIVQILIEFLLIIKQNFPMMMALISIPCFVTALLILRSTINENHPINQRKEVSNKDKQLFFIYFAADIFTDLAIFNIIFAANLFGLTFFQYLFFIIEFLSVFRICQFVNLVCSMYALYTSERELRIRSIIVVTLTPFVVILIFTYMLANINFSLYGGSTGKTGANQIYYLVPFIWQIAQFVLSFNLIRLINRIYTKQNTRIDINNIYTGFILFKFSYYIPC